MLKVEDIHTYYGDSYILQGISLEVGPGQVLGILGRNAMGKNHAAPFHHRVYAPPAGKNYLSGPGHDPQARL